MFFTRSTIASNFRRFFATDSNLHGTTILSVRKGNKIRRVGKKSEIYAGFAGSTADAFTLLERLEKKLEEFPDQTMRACVELAKLWRTDRYLRNLHATLIVVDKNISLTVTGNGDVIEPHDGILGTGSGGFYAIAAARALYPIENLDAEEIAKRSMQIAADIDVFTNGNTVVQVINTEEEDSKTETLEASKK